MQPAHSLLFGLWLLAAAGFILVTGAGLPDTVASHFGPSGAADGFMPRTAYLALMAGFAAGLPAIMVWVQSRVMRRAPQRLRLPNRDYWVAPERIEEALRMITEKLMQFGAMLALLLCFVHWEVVQANLRNPPQLDNARMITALAVLLLAVAVWVYRLYARFRRPPARRGPIS